MIRSILWLDDDEALISSSMPVFLKHGFHVYKATTVSRALQVLAETAVDGVLLDKQLAGSEDGMQLLPMLKRHYPKVKVAVFTAFPEYDELVSSKDEGAAAYLPKLEKCIPVDPLKQEKFFLALHRIFDTPQTVPDATLKSGAVPYDSIRPLMGIAGALACLFAVAVLGIWFLLRETAAYAVPGAAVVCIVVYCIMGALLLRAQGRISERGFLSLMGESLRVIPQLRGFGGKNRKLIDDKKRKQIKRQKDENI